MQSIPYDLEIVFGNEIWSLMRVVSQKWHYCIQKPSKIPYSKLNPVVSCDMVSIAVCPFAELSRQYEVAQVEEEATAALPAGKTDLYSLRKKLMDTKRKKVSFYELLRNETIDYLDSVVRLVHHNSVFSSKYID